MVPVTVNMPLVPLGVTEEEEARLRDEAYSRQLTAERAEADRQINAEMLEKPVVLDGPSPDKAARRTSREVEHAPVFAAYLTAFLWAQPPPPSIDRARDNDDMDDCGETPRWWDTHFLLFLFKLNILISIIWTLGHTDLVN